MTDIEEVISAYSPKKLAVLKFRLQTDFLTHAQFFLPYRERQPFIPSPHHILIARTIERVISGEITRLIINVPPGYTKTEMIVIQFCSFSFSFNPACRFMHISGGNTLPLLNSTYIKQQLTSPIYQKLWGVTLRDDTRAKALWRTNAEGMFYAVSSGSQILGFRAGRMIPGFHGALLIDDPQKLEDITSPVKVEYFPNRYKGEMRHRVAWRQTPIIFIMQRLGDEDICNWLLEGGSGEKWHHLCLPAIIPCDNSMTASKYSHAIPIEHDLKPGPLWQHKHTLEELKVIEKSDAHNYYAQYMQDPHKKGGSIFETSWWRYYAVLPDYEWKAIFCDTALKDGQHNDYTVFQCWAKHQGRIYLIDQYRNKIKASGLKRVFIEFWNKHTGNIVQPLRAAYIEDKSSGIQLIQDIQEQGGIPVVPIPRPPGKSKVFRANNLCGWIRSGLLYLPENVDWLYDYKNEFERFSPLDTHKHDDQIDATLDAIEHMLITGPQLKADDKDNAASRPIAPSKDSKIW